MEPYNQGGRIQYSACKYGMQGCNGCGAMNHKIANWPKKAWNRQGNMQGSGIRTNLLTQRGCPPTSAASGSNRGGKRPQAGG